jgi:hypothetical protein
MLATILIFFLRASKFVKLILFPFQIKAPYSFDFVITMKDDAALLSYLIENRNYWESITERIFCRQSLRHPQL